MSLLFGRLTQDFVSFGTTLNNSTLPGAAGDQARADFPAAAAAFRHSAAQNASYLVYIGIGMLFATFIYMYVWVYTGEVNAKRLRERYLKAILRQDIAYFDNVGAGEVATRIQTDTRGYFSDWSRLSRPHLTPSFFLDLVQQGISEKVALVMNFIAAFVTGFALAYAKSWRLALALSSILPCIAITGGVMNKFISTYMQ